MPVTEHLPRLARQAHRLTVVRSVGFDGRLGNHSPACYHMLTGQEPQGDDAVLAPPRPTDQPTMGSAAARLRPTPGSVPAFVMVPDVLIENAHLTPGQFAGWLGGRYEAFRLQGDRAARASRSRRWPDRRTCRTSAWPPAANCSRRSIRGPTWPRPRRENWPPTTSAPSTCSPAPAPATAFDIDRRAGAACATATAATSSGQSVLLARRLVEAGVRFVNVHWPNVGGGANWDTHSNGFNRLKNDLLPLADRAVARAARRPGRPRAAGRDAGAGADRVRPRAADRQDVPELRRAGRARPLVELLQRGAGRRRRARAAGLRLAPTPRGATRRTGRSTPADLTATVYRHSASTRRRC